MKKKIPIYFLLPSLLFYLLIRIFPMLCSLFYSITNWDGMHSDYKIVGMQNFVKIFSDHAALDSIRITLIFALIVVVVTNTIGLLLALLLDNASRLSIFYRVVIFMPYVLSAVAVGFIWKTIYAYNGIFDYLSKLFMGEAAISILSSKDTALLGIAATQIWVTVGFSMVLLIAALKTIPIELHEASEIDGCNPWQKFSKVIFPLLIPGLSVSIIMTTIGALKQFAIVKVMTDGGPMGSTSTISLKIISESMDFGMFGYSSAIACILFLIIFLVTFIQNKLLERIEVEY